METITLKTKELGNDFTFDGYSLEPQFKNIEQFYGIPATLHTVDKKFGTNTFKEVLEAAAPTIQVMVDENKNVQVLDPKSVFMSDDSFNELVAQTAELTGVEPEIRIHKFQRQAVVELADRDSDSFIGDAFKRYWSITRRAEGGLSFQTEVMRLACSNGMMIPDKQFSGFIRNASVDTVYLTGFNNTANDFSVAEYLSNLFMNEGRPVPASVADMLEMRDCLFRLTQDDLANILFPVDQVKQFYQAQGIEVDSLARKYLDKLPTGLSYYQCLNILTNGAKAMLEKTVDNQVSVAKFAQPRRINNMKNVDLHWKGEPEFSDAQLKLWMGDGNHTAPKIELVV